MPLYEYACEACGHQLEVQQKLSEAPLKSCPSCGKDALQRLISATAFVLKGGGWYKDGYGSSKEKPRTENQRTDRLEKAISDDKQKNHQENQTKTESSGKPDGGGSSSPPSSSTSNAA